MRREPELYLPYKEMTIVETDQPFPEYILSLSEPARKNYRYVQKHNHDLVYEQVLFNREEVEKFMQLWEHQLIRGQFRQWAFPVGHVEDLQQKGELMVFAAKRAGVAVALHFIQKRDGYWECHPPMFEKNKGNQKKYLAKFMWFSLIKFACENRIGSLDLGGGPDDWQEHLRNRDKYPNPAYKFIYIPDAIKRNPGLAKPYIIERPQCRLLLKS